MLNEDDRKALDAMDTQTVVLLASKVEDFINEADRLLNAYPTVDYNNVFDTALQLGNLANSLRDFSEKVWGAFSKIFGDYQPSVQRKFGMARMLVPEAMSEYGTLRNALAKKRDILDEFKNDLKAYLEQ